MGKIHYVWFGNPKGNEALTKNATITPNLMVEAVHGIHEVHYWIGGNAGFDAPLDDRIIRHYVNAHSLLGIPGGTSHLATNAAAKMKIILDRLVQFKAFAAAKDLVSFAVMYASGGYFFDTTTMVGEGYHQLVQDEETSEWQKPEGMTTTNIARLLAGHDEPKAPFSAATGAYKIIYPGNETADYVIGYGGAGGIVPKPTSVNVPNFDVWAMYCPKPRHAAFARVVQTYINRAINLGFTDPDNVKPMGSRTLSTIMNDTNDKSLRNFIIAGLSTTSILEGFHAYATGKALDMKELGWPIAVLNKPVALTIASTGFRGWLEKKGIVKKKTTTVQTITKTPGQDMHPVFKKNKSAPKKAMQMDLEKLYAGMESAAVSLPMIGIQKRFAGSWR